MTVSAGNELSNNLYFGPVRWILYGLTVILLTVGVIQYFRKQGICTIDEAKREQKRIVNTAIIALVSTFVLYLIWNYVILELLGIAVGLPWEDSAFWG